MKWISVKDRLPDMEEWVLVYIPGELGLKVYVCCREEISSEPCCRLHPKGWWWIHGDCGPSDADEVTHWMPLPPKPEESDE